LQREGRGLNSDHDAAAPQKRQPRIGKTTEISMRKNALIALFAAVALGIAGASVARAGDSGENHQDNDRGSTPTINHPTWSGSPVVAGGAFGFAPAPAQKHRRVHEETRSR
jgi:hypothetical protein